MNHVLTATEFENTDLKEIDWLFGRLKKHKQTERENMLKALHGESYSEHMK